MADTGERDVRDRLAEALWRADLNRPPMIQWDRVIEIAKDDWHRQADKILSALPTVGLRIGRVEE